MYQLKSMNYVLLKDLMDLLSEFESNNNNDFSNDINGFKQWIYDQKSIENAIEDLDWNGKSDGRSAESMIATSLVHLNRYAKNYSKAAIQDSEFSTQDEFVYLIQLKSLGAMTKMELIKRNVQEKTVGMQIINRLIHHGWVVQRDSETDKRSKIISITKKGLTELNAHMDKIRLATNIVCGNLSSFEKKELLSLLSKLDHFHQNIFHAPVANQNLLMFVNENYLRQ